MKTLSADVAIAKVRAIYASLAARPLERQCVNRAQCCHFKLTGLIPYLTKGEALVAAKGWRATGRKQFRETPEGSCPMLDTATSQCLVYNERPFGCRTHFCSAAGGPFSRREVLDLIRELEAIDADLGGSGPRKLIGAVADALGELR